MARFAPSPTGPLHLGSLLAAVGSCLDARAQGGRWLLRMEDLDTPRVVPGCADQMLRTLEAFGFEWDGDVLYQSTRRDAYREAMQELRSAGRLYECSCTRRDLTVTGDDAPGYPGTCRHGVARPGPVSLRFRVSDSPIYFDDLFLGRQEFDLNACGDVVVQRRDGLASYQLAVLVDDAFQGVTRVVRGADLVSSTPWQLDMQSALGLMPPIYGHLPLVTEPDGSKLSKAKRSLPLDIGAAPRALAATLTLLSQTPPPELALGSLREIWDWALANWNPQALAAQARTSLSLPRDSAAEIT